MDTCLHLPTSVADELNGDSIWDSLYPLLLPLVKRWVYASNIVSWIGQETDIAWDIVLTTIKRTYEYALNARRAGIAIASLERLSIVIAKNCFLDLRRKDARLLHFQRDGYSRGSWSSTHDGVDLSEVVLDKIHQDQLSHELAKEIAGYPPKMRKAILIDIAMRMEFDSQPTTLQRAFLEVGIQLQDYQYLLPTDPAAKARHASLVSLGYKRIRMSTCILQFT